MDNPNHPGEEGTTRKTVSAIILDKNNKILLIKRGHDPFKDNWALPGGHIDKDEMSEAAIKREVKEETGLTFDPKFFGGYDENFPNYKWKSIVSVFFGGYKGKASIKRKKEIKDLKWLKIEEVQDLNMAFDHKKILFEYLAHIGLYGE